LTWIRTFFAHRLKIFECVKVDFAGVCQSMWELQLYHFLQR